MNLRTRLLESSPIVAFAALACLAGESANSQGPVQAAPDTVRWHVAVAPAATVHAGQSTAIELTGQILTGWHVYGLKQHADGPTELRFKVDDNQVAQQVGAP